MDIFGFVVIESFDNDFKLKLGRNIFEIEKGRKYIPIFCGGHSASVKIIKGLKIFFGPGYIDDFNNINSHCWTKKYNNDENFNIDGNVRGGNYLWYFLINFDIIYKNLIDNFNCQIVFIA